MSRNQLKRYPLSDAVKPLMLNNRHYECIRNRYWVVDDRQQLLFYENWNSPQCNPSEKLAHHVAAIHQKNGEEVHVEFVKCALVPIDLSEYAK